MHPDLLVQAKQGRETANDAHFDCDKAPSESQHNWPLLKQQAKVQTAACGHKEQTQKNASEWPNVCLNLWSEHYLYLMFEEKKQ